MFQYQGVCEWTACIQYRDGLAREVTSEVEETSTDPALIDLMVVGIDFFLDDLCKDPLAD